MGQSCRECRHGENGPELASYKWQVALRQARQDKEPECLGGLYSTGGCAQKSGALSKTCKHCRVPLGRTRHNWRWAGWARGKRVASPECVQEDCEFFLAKRAEESFRTPSLVPKWERSGRRVRAAPSVASI